MNLKEAKVLIRKDNFDKFNEAVEYKKEFEIDMSLYIDGKRYDEPIILCANGTWRYGYLEV